MAAQKVLAQSPGRPDAKLRATRGIDAVAHRDDGVEAVESQRLVGRSNVHFLHIAFGRQLAVGGLVEDDLATVGLRSLVHAVTQRSEGSRSAQG